MRKIMFLEEKMGIFLLIVVGIVVLIVFVKMNKRKQAIEELAECRGHDLAIKIKDELEKREINFGQAYKDMKVNFGEMHKYFDVDDACGEFSCLIADQFKIEIYCSRSMLGLDSKIYRFRANKTLGRNRYCGIKNDNVAILVCVSSKNESFQDVPEVINIASEVIINNGYGQCSLIEP